MATSSDTAPADEAQYIQTSLRLPAELHAAVLVRARQDDRSFNATVREAVRRYLAEAPRP